MTVIVKELRMTGRSNHSKKRDRRAKIGQCANGPKVTHGLC